jgi:DNA-binding MarR family transcriptional regulator
LEKNCHFNESQFSHARSASIAKAVAQYGRMPLFCGTGSGLYQRAKASDQVPMPTSEEPLQKGECFATSVRKASRRLTQLYDDALAPSGLRSTQFSILAEVAARTAPPTLMELAEAMVSDRSSLGHALRPLVRDGYVALRRGETDRRTQQIVLTDRGHDKFRESLLRWRTAQDAFVSLYGGEWSRTFRAAVLRIAHDGRLGTMTGDAE